MGEPEVKPAFALTRYGEARSAFALTRYGEAGSAFAPSATAREAG